MLTGYCAGIGGSQTAGGSCSGSPQSGSSTAGTLAQGGSASIYGKIKLKQSYI